MKLKKFLILMFCLFSAYTIYAGTYNLNVGETIELNVPSVSMGYVDKAIWGCSNPAISFLSKSDASAVIKVVSAFDGYATIELVYVEKYVDKKGFTRANTYSKKFYVSCNGGTSSGSSQSKATSILVQPTLELSIGETVTIPYQLLPEGSTAEVFSRVKPGNVFFVTHNSKERYYTGRAKNAGEERLQIYFYTDEEGLEEVSATCYVTVYDPTWINPQSIYVKSIYVLEKDDSFKILPSITPQNATTIYKWDSSDRTVAYVDEGIITATKSGCTNLTVTTLNGLTRYCTLIVIDDKSNYKGIDKAANRVAEMLQIAETDIIR